MGARGEWELREVKEVKEVREVKEKEKPTLRFESEGWARLRVSC